MINQRPEKTTRNDSDETWLKNTLLFQQWEQMKDEILRHKWIESEKAGYDIGWDRAAVDWMIKHGPLTKNHPSPRAK